MQAPYGFSRRSVLGLVGYAVAAAGLAILVAATAEYSFFTFLIFASVGFAFVWGTPVGLVSAVIGSLASGTLAIATDSAQIDMEYVFVVLLWLAATAVVGRLSTLSRRLRRRENEITALLQEKDQLLVEVHHRIKNHMVVVRTILGQFADEASPGEGAAIQEAERHIDTMMELYQLLYERPAAQTVELVELLGRILAGLASIYEPISRLEVAHTVEDLAVPARPALSIGIIVNELVTNAYKYSQPGSTGRVEVQVAHGDENGSGGRSVGGGIRIVVQSPSQFPEAVIDGEYPGFGLQLVSMYAQQYGGSFTVANQADGTGVARALLPDLGT